MVMRVGRSLQSLADLLAVVCVVLAVLPDDLGAESSSSSSSKHLPPNQSSCPPPLPHSGSVPILSDDDGPAAGSVSSEAGSASPRSHPAPLNCLDPDRLVAVRVRMRAKRRAAKAGVFLCPAVKLLQLRVAGQGGHFVRVPPRQHRVTSCARANDTWVVRKGQHRSHVTVQVAVDPGLSSDTELVYSYSVHEDSMVHKRKGHKEERQARRGDRHSVERALRWKRSPIDYSATGSPHLNSTHVLEGSQSVGSTADCGQSKTCIRYGREGCGHLTCDYMLSYRTLDKSHADIELSARGPGWVAVGFSSDKFMGGDDDVIGCKQRQKLSAEVVPVSLGNTVKHTQPQEKANRLELLGGLLQGDHIYCRLRRPLKYKERLANSDLDLVNDWHQLYAFGDIDGTGRILQHTELPRASEHKISMIRVTQIMVVTSAASLLPLPASCLVVFPLPLILVFAGS